MLTDPIADLLTRIRNANQAKHETLSAPYSQLKEKIVELLVEEGYIEKYSVNGTGVKKQIHLTLKYVDNQKVIRGIKRISKPGLRVYTQRKDIPKVLNGLGIAVISTSQGLVTDRKARTLNIGGEILAHV